MKRRTFIVAFVVGSLLAGTGYSVWNFAGQRGALVVPGVIEADDLHVGSKIGGRVLKVVAREGQTVKEGEPLVLLEPGDLDAALAEAHARLRQAEAKYALLNSGAREEEIERTEAALKMAQAELDRLLSSPRQEELAKAAQEWAAAKARWEESRDALKRADDLSKRDLIARQEYRSALAAEEEAEQKMRAARRRHDLLLAGARKGEIEAARLRMSEADAKLRELRRGYRRQEIAHARSEMETARAKMQWIRTQLDETVIRSPADALVERLDLEPGDLVAPGKPVVTLLRTGSLWVRAYLSQAKLAQVRPGLKVTVHVESATSKDFSGVVRRIHRQGELEARKAEGGGTERILQVFETEVMIDDPDHLLRPGMNADVIIPKG
jgi:multidrug resistance efflux pump